MSLYYHDGEYDQLDADPDEAPQALFLMRLLLRHDPAALIAQMDDPTDMLGLRAVIEWCPSQLTVYLGESSPPAINAFSLMLPEHCMLGSCAQLKLGAHSCLPMQLLTMRFGSTVKVPAKCVLNYYIVL